METERALAGAKPTTVSPGTTPAAPASAPPAQEVASAPSRELKFDPVGAGKSTTVRAVPKSDNSIVANTGPIAARKNTPPPPPAPVVENKAPAGGYLNYKADDIALNSDFSQNRGKLPSPVDGVITLGFGRYKIEGVGPDIVGDNPGVTYTAQVGAPVRRYLVEKWSVFLKWGNLICGNASW
ncbi:hypothetical protein [Niabella hibiscisoli]|uniref:hypothetical protein n=1 Tax=Niabella hibiscisoli TaxID=1825928 RepID=UPI001F105BDF|nr:hypothetical protein [Niabella hibiscisoli]MCH5717506.1 hypothetical protein [Niabella hibiscisoli]